MKVMNAILDATTRDVLVAVAAEAGDYGPEGSGGRVRMLLDAIEDTRSEDAPRRYGLALRLVRRKLEDTLAELRVEALSDAVTSILDAHAEHCVELETDPEGDSMGEALETILGTDDDWSDASSRATAYNGVDPAHGSRWDGSRYAPESAVDWEDVLAWLRETGHMESVLEWARDGCLDPIAQNSHWLHPGITLAYYRPEEVHFQLDLDDLVREVREATGMDVGESDIREVLGWLEDNPHGDTLVDAPREESSMVDCIIETEYGGALVMDREAMERWWEHYHDELDADPEASVWETLVEWKRSRS